MTRNAERTLSEPEVKCVVSQLLLGLAHMHRHGIVHRVRARVRVGVGVRVLMRPFRCVRTSSPPTCCCRNQAC